MNATTRRAKLFMILMGLIFSVTFFFGIFANPTFNIYDFCMNLSSEILGLVITLVFVDGYIRARQKKEDKEDKED